MKSPKQRSYPENADRAARAFWKEQGTLVPSPLMDRAALKHARDRNDEEPGRLEREIQSVVRKMVYRLLKQLDASQKMFPTIYSFAQRALMRRLRKVFVSSEIPFALCVRVEDGSFIDVVDIARRTIGMVLEEGKERGGAGDS